MLVDGFGLFHCGILYKLSEYSLAFSVENISKNEFSVFCANCITMKDTCCVTKPVHWSAVM